MKLFRSHLLAAAVLAAACLAQPTGPAFAEVTLTQEQVQGLTAAAAGDEQQLANSIRATVLAAIEAGAAPADAFVAVEAVLHGFVNNAAGIEFLTGAMITAASGIARTMDDTDQAAFVATAVAAVLATVQGDSEKAGAVMQAAAAARDGSVDGLSTETMDDAIAIVIRSPVIAAENAAIVAAAATKAGLAVENDGSEGEKQGGLGSDGRKPLSAN